MFQKVFRLVSILLLALVGLSACNPPAGPQGPPGAQTPAQRTGAEVKEVDVVIVGAGLAGLTTAYELKKAGVSYRILEMEPRVGGRVRTGTYPDKSRAEVGLAEFWSGNPAIDLARELGVELESSDVGLSSFMSQGKLYPFSNQKDNQDFIKSVLKDDYPAYQAWDKKMTELTHQVEDGTPGPELMALQDVSFQDWLDKEPISPLARELVKAIVEPEIGTAIRRISALEGIAEWHIFAAPGATPWHVVGGNQKLTEAIADAVGRENISLNT